MAYVGNLDTNLGVFFCIVFYNINVDNWEDYFKSYFIIIVVDNLYVILGFVLIIAEVDN